MPKSARGEIIVTPMPPKIILITITGYWDTPLLPDVLKELELGLRGRTGVSLFFDAEMMNGYDSAIRVGMTDWFRAHRPSLQCIHGLIRSKIVAMGATLAKLAMDASEDEIHASRASWERAFKAAGGALSSLRTK
jgi:hypothetical protein